VTAPDIEAALRAALQEALRARDTVALAALRSTLGAIDNARAADPSLRPAAEQGAIAGGVRGLGAGEVARVELTETALRAVVAAEIEGRMTAAEQYDGLGRAEDAARLRAEAAILRGL